MSNLKENSVINRRPQKEIITPHRLTVAILIQEFCKLRESCEFQELSEVERKKFIRNYCILILKLIQSPDISLDELLDLTTNIEHVINETLATNLKQTITSITTVGVRYLLDTVESIGRLPTFEDNTIKNGIIHIRNSVVGYFLRRFIVYFDKLTFSEVTVILEAYKRYFAVSALFKADENGGRTPVKRKITSLDDWHSNRDQWSRRQAELFLATQAALLTNNQERALNPVALNKQIKKLLESNPELSEAHYLNYINYLRVQEFCGAMDSLYQCFDGNAASNCRATNEDKTKSYRYSALNLAVLHFHFDHKDEALAALKEAIRMAQEASDNVCLQHALSWLYCLTQCNRDIEHSILKSLEINLSYIMSLGILFFGQHGGITCGNPKQIFETLTKSDLMNFQCSHQDLISHSYSQKASLWTFYGKTEMSSLWSQLLLNFNTDNACLSRTYYGGGFCEALCNIANHAYLQGEYGAANSLFAFAKERFPNQPFSHIWMLCENVFKFTFLLYREKFDEAEIVAHKISTIDKWESCLRMAELDLLRRDFARAHDCVNQILAKCQKGERGFRIDVQVRAMILLAEIQCATTFPDSVPPGILALLNSSLAYCNDYHLEFYASLVQLHVANVQLLLGMPAQALSVLERCMVQVLAHGGVYDRSRAMLLYVKCMVANAGEDNRSAVIKEGAVMLNKVKRGFEKIEAYYRVKDVLYLQARLYNEINLNDERNKSAREYRILDEEHPTTNPHTLLTYL